VSFYGGDVECISVVYFGVDLEWFILGGLGVCEVVCDDFGVCFDV